MWADAMGLPEGERRRWLRAVALHDALKDAPQDLLDQLAPCWRGIPALQHGPAAAARAEQDGEKDQGILDAVRYHSIGYRDWELVGRVLYLADFLEPGRSYHAPEHGTLLQRVPEEIDAVLRSVAAERIAGVVQAGAPLLRETTDFWNALVGGS
jgi:HD superfamily phosphohydrolase YqeK